MKFLVMLMAVLVAAAGCVSNVEEPTPTPVPTPYPTAVGFSQPTIEPIGIGMVSHVTAFGFPIGDTDSGQIMIVSASDESPVTEAAEAMFDIEMFGTPSLEFYVSETIRVTITLPEHRRNDVDEMFALATKFMLAKSVGTDQ